MEYHFCWYGKEREGYNFMRCEESFITMKFIWHGYLVLSLNNCAHETSTETGLMKHSANNGVKPMFTAEKLGPEMVKDMFVWAAAFVYFWKLRLPFYFKNSTLVFRTCVYLYKLKRLKKLIKLSFSVFYDSAFIVFQLSRSYMRSSLFVGASNFSCWSLKKKKTQNACKGSRSHVLGLVLDAIQLLHFAWAGTKWNGPAGLAIQPYAFIFHLVQLVISVDTQSLPFSPNHHTIFLIIWWLGAGELVIRTCVILLINWWFLWPGAPYLLVPALTTLVDYSLLLFLNPFF